MRIKHCLLVKVHLHSSSFSVDFSKESACLPNRPFHRAVWIKYKILKTRVSRLGFLSLQTKSSNIRSPTRYPNSFSLKTEHGTVSCVASGTGVGFPAERSTVTYFRSRSWIPLTRFCAYWIISEKRNAKAPKLIYLTLVNLLIRVSVVCHLFVATLSVWCLECSQPTSAPFVRLRLRSSSDLPRLCRLSVYMDDVVERREALPEGNA